MAIPQQAFVTIEADATSAIRRMTISIDPAADEGLRVSLPYDLVLGESRMRDTRVIGEPLVERSTPEFILLVGWTYRDPNTAEALVRVLASTPTSFDERRTSTRTST
jgi:hypothetical protein